jgi:FkbM family methyltransferase
VPEVPLRKEDLVIDIGANHGYFACYAAAKGCRLICFEPSATNQTWLKKNIAINGLCDQVELHATAVGAQSGSTTLYLLPKLGGAMHTIEPAFAAAYGHADITLFDTEQVPVVSLATYLANKGYPAVRLLKLDCEGSEYAILASLPPEALARIDSIVFEYHGNYSLQSIAALPTLANFHMSMNAGDAFFSAPMFRLVRKEVFAAIDFLY